MNNKLVFKTNRIFSRPSFAFDHKLVHEAAVDLYLFVKIKIKLCRINVIALTWIDWKEAEKWNGYDLGWLLLSFTRVEAFNAFERKVI